MLEKPLFWVENPNVDFTRLSWENIWPRNVIFLKVAEVQLSAYWFVREEFTLIK
jgi:hypothetical protein